MKTLEQLKADVAKIQADIERLEKDSRPDDGVPKIGQKYFFVGNAGGAASAYWADNEVDYDRLAIGNVFFTREAAKIKVRQLKVIQRLRVLAKGFVPYWNSGYEYKCRLYYGHREQSWKLGFDRTYQYSLLPYFETVVDAQVAIKELGEELDVLLLDPHAMR